MAAAPYNGRIVFVPVGNPKGGVQQSETIYGPDVNADYIQWVNFGNQDFMFAKFDCLISDIQLSAAGTDTSQLKILVNGRDSGLRLMKAGLVATVNNRLNEPIGKIKAGSMIQIQELT